MGSDEFTCAFSSVQLEARLEREPAKEASALRSRECPDWVFDFEAA